MSNIMDNLKEAWANKIDIIIGVLWGLAWVGALTLVFQAGYLVAGGC